MDADVVYPIFSDVDKPTDFNDLYQKLAILMQVYERVVLPTQYYAKDTDTDLFQCFWLAIHWWCEKGARRIKRAFGYCPRAALGGCGSHVGQSACIYEYWNHP